MDKSDKEDCISVDIEKRTFTNWFKTNIHNSKSKT